MSALNSPATTTNHYAKDDPTAASNVKLASGHVATVGHPADGVVINEDLHKHTHHAAHTATHTTTTTTTQQQAVAQPAGAQPVHTLPSGANGDGLVLASNLGGPLGGSAVLGQPGATADERAATYAATSVNPGINVGVSTHQYTAPVGTWGIGGGVTDPGTGMAGVVHPTNAIGQPTTHVAGEHNANNPSYQQGGAVPTGTTTTTQTHHHTAMGGSEYVGGQAPNYTHASTTGGAPVSGGITASGTSSVPVTDNSNVPYKAGDYTEGKPVTNSNAGVI